MKPFLRLAAIIGTLPNTLTNGTTADATQVMADFNKIVNDVNANAAPLAGVALLAAANTFTMVQFGVNATATANFPTAGQVQRDMNYGSDVGTANAFAINPTPPISAYSDGMPFSFLAANMNGGAATLAVSSLAANPIVNPTGSSLSSAQIPKGSAVTVLTDATNSKFFLVSISGSVISNPMTAKGDIMVQAGSNVVSRFAAGANQTLLGYLGSEALGVAAFTFGPGVQIGGKTISISSASMGGAGLVQLALSSAIVAGTSQSQALTPQQTRTALGFSGFFVSAQQTITSGGALTIAHGLGREPVMVQTLMVCTSNDANYTAGQHLLLTGYSFGNNRGVSVVVDATNLTIRFGSGALAIEVLDATTGAVTAATNANWKIIFRAWA